MARRLRQVTDLYTTGKVVTLRDGSPLWVQPMNPFEQDTARNEAQIARARLSLALRELGSDEQNKVKMYFFEDGHEEAVAKVVEAKVAERMPRVLDGIRNDPEWTERLQILERGDEDTAKPLEETERDLLLKISDEFTREVGSRVNNEREYQMLTYDGAEDEVLWDAYLEWYIERRCAEMSLAEFRTHQLMFGVRLCSGTRTETDWNHAECGGHMERLFADKAEVRSAPEDLQALLLDAYDDVEMTVREAKNSDRQGSSFDSSPLPSAAAESTASTPVGTPDEPPGSWSPLSPTPSLSSAGAS